MLKSGREEGEAAFARQAAQAAAERAAVVWLAPNVVVVGHGPDRPNTGYDDRFSSAPRPLSAEFFPGGLSPVLLADTFPVRRSLCLAEMRTGPSRVAFTYVTDCPSWLEPAQTR